MIRFDRLSFTYPAATRPTLREVSFTVEAGALALVVGRSGAGKSTLLRCLNGLVPHFTGGRLSGRLEVCRLDPVAAGPSVLSRTVGLVFQDPEAQFVVDRVEDEVAFALENLAVPPREMHARVDAALASVGASGLAARPLATLSGGEKQRVAIAAALALTPEILALDEPTSQLDPESAEDVLTSLLRVRAERGLTVVLAEHRLERVLHLADLLIVIEPDGSVRAGPPRDVIGQLELAPPIVEIARRLGWPSAPRTLDEARAFLAVPAAPHSKPPIDVAIDVAKQAAIAPAVCAPASRLRPPLLAVRDLRVRYGEHVALGGVDLTIEEGEIVGLLGRNGSGKTTLLRAVVGLVAPAGGSIELAGRSIGGRDTAEICRSVGYLPQVSDDLLFAETVEAELEITLRNHGLLARPPIPIDQLLDWLGLREHANAYPRELSVGERLRVALAAVTVTRPWLLLLDEPSRGLDYRLKRRLADLLHDWRDRGAGILVVSHDVELLARVASRAIVLDAGRVARAGSSRQILRPPGAFATQTAALFPDRDWLLPEEVTAPPVAGVDRPDRDGTDR